MEAPIKTRYDKAGPQVAEALRRRRFEAHYVPPPRRPWTWP
ncbi:MAG: hypothetical protein ACLR5H_09975 [Oscillospiraceae bacterium]